MAPFAENAPGSGRSGAPRIPAMERAMRLIAVRARSEAELRLRLLRAGYPPAEVRAAVSECLRRGYLNDGLLAADCAAFCRERGLGARAVRARLRRRGLAAAAVDEALSGEDPDAELAAALRAYASKAPSLVRESDPRKRRDKLLRFMASRGFSASTVRRVLEKTEAASDGEAPEGGAFDAPDF